MTNIPNQARTQMSPLVRNPNLSSARVNSYVGAHTDRQRRFEARSARRDGDWFILDIPTPLLWLEEECLLSPYGDCDFIWPEPIGLWP
jgi:hypothetical protein